MKGLGKVVWSKRLILFLCGAFLMVVLDFVSKWLVQNFVGVGDSNRITVIENFKLTTPLSHIKGMGEKIMKALAYALPLNVIIMLIAIVAYCVALVEGVSFYIATPAFLYFCMCYLMKKDYVKNILWTACVMAFIVLVFRMLFSVVFP